MNLRTNKSSKRVATESENSVVSETEIGKFVIDFSKARQETSDLGENPLQAFNQLGFRFFCKTNQANKKACMTL